MDIPVKFKGILEKDQAQNGLVEGVIRSFEPLFKDNKPFFFEEYTDHGIEHVEKVLKTAEFLIPDKSFQESYIQPKDVAILIVAIVLHDIGMHTQYATFRAMIEGKYDDVRVDILDEKTWKELWSDYLSEERHWSSRYRESVLGYELRDKFFNESHLSNKDDLDGSDKKIIGEFLRRHHERLAHEIALKGFIGSDDKFSHFGNDRLSERYKQFAGIVARSHGTDIRKTFKYLQHLGLGKTWKNPEGISIVYLMVLLRIADVLQIDETRTNLILLEIKTINSYKSEREHKKHLTVLGLNFDTDDPELIYVECTQPENAQLYVEIQDLIKYIQHEFDLSWAILGETYGLSEKTKIKFRRIDSNLEDKDFLETINYVPKKIAFEVNNDVAKLLVAPLYGDNPTYGVRELVQNATDACKERMKIEQDNGNTNYKPLVTVSIDKIDEEKYLFKIKDNGKGMTLDEIQNYFLSVGSSFRKTVEWKKEFEGKITRNGRFGIGVLATFLLGEEISVKTKSYKENYACCFKTKLDSEYVEIVELDNFDIGTDIEILMSTFTYNRLIVKKYGIEWTKWYIGKVPIVQYLLNGEIQSKERVFDSSKIREIYPKGYEKVQWEYENSHMYMSVFCNDIIVPSFRQPPPPNNSIISHIPSVYIEDTQGRLPLALDRNNLETRRLPFEDELLIDVSKDLIANLLMMPIFSPKKIHYFNIFPHNTEFLYLAQGFTLAVNYFINKMENNYHLLNILTTDSDVLSNADVILRQSNKYIIFVSWGFESKKKTFEFYMMDNDCLALLLNKEFFAGSITTYFTLKGKVEWKNEVYLFYKKRRYKNQINLFEESNINSILKEMNAGIVSIQELPVKSFKKTTKKSNIILNQLFEKYFGDNVIIPYDMEERKKLYPLAFEELKDYMKDYENK